MTRKKMTDYPFNNIEIISTVSSNSKGTLGYFNKPVGWVNYQTKKKQSIPDIAFLSWHGSSVHVVNKIIKNDGTPVYTFADFYSHWNIYNEVHQTTVKIREEKYIIYYQTICTGDNAISGYQLRDNPEIATLTLGTIIKGQYSGSPANRDLFSVDNFKKDYTVNNLTPSAGVLELVLGKQASTISASDKQQFLANLKDTGYYVKRCGNTSYTYVKTKAEIKKLVDISKYYPILSVAEIKEKIGDIPKQKVDLICLGLGSAGTNILEQIGRTNMVNDFLLVDFDTVEEKNLRNQFYVTSQIGRRKAEEAQDSMWHFNSNNKVKNYNKKFQDVTWGLYKSKYIVLGFDSILTRLEALDYIKSGKIETQYIIDTRYEGLEASIYFIDTSDEDQMKYYEEQLISDGELLAQSNHIYTGEEEYFEELVTKMASDCEGAMVKLGLSKGTTLTTKVCGYCNDICRSNMCRRSIITMLNNAQVSEQEVKNLINGGTSCVAWNIIDIYKYASSFITSAIREIEEKRTQPFVHIEATTDRIPNSMILRRPVDKKELCAIM